MRHQREVLVDQTQSERMCLARIVDAARFPIDDDLARIGTMVAHHAFDQRALAGAVLSDDRMKRAAGKCDGDVVKGVNSPEAFSQSPHFDHGNHLLIVSSLGAPKSRWRVEELQLRMIKVRT